VKEMKQKGVEVIISLGDNTQSGGKKYYKQLKRIENKYGIKILWVHGNHSYKGDDYLAPRNYIYDKEGIRFIILDTGVCPKSQMNAGCLDQSQVDFLHHNQTGNDAILQHVPPLIENTCELRTDFIAEENLIVLAGHFHKEMNCGNVKVFKPLTEHKKLEYKINLTSEPVTFLGDNLHIENALRNIIENAINYTEQGFIHIDLSVKNDNIIISVSDSGLGLSDSDQKRLFQKGGRGEDAVKVNTNSTGYGLYIVKSIIEQHGGTVSAKSEGRNKGSTFTIILPIKK
jgi:anti-sigma regulatory factor (Ser/Thr protein kinase)/predicted phosphodiesterase